MMDALYTKPMGKVNTSHTSHLAESTERIIEALRAVPKGKVSCYRDIALAARLPNGARQVVRVLHSMAEKHALPWHRIIRAAGFIALESCEGRELQTQLLKDEGVEVSKFGWVDLAVYGTKSRRSLG
jgi:methylated-DNA-protein-cysteine methyltransferase-like protein